MERDGVNCEASFRRDDSKGSRDRLVILLRDEDNVVESKNQIEDETEKCRKRGSLFSNCMSAQDLRSVDMDMEAEDCSSPRGVLEVCSVGLESETSTDKTSTTESEAPSNSKAVSQWRGFFKLWKKKSVKRLPSFPPLNMSHPSRRKSKSIKDAMPPVLKTPAEANFYNFKASWKNFSLSDLQNATNNFSNDNLIGKGGYAEVYKGCLAHGQLIAVKRLMKGTSEERTAGFLSELGTIAHVDHPNTAKLIGYGVEGGLHIVLQLSPLGSLGSILRGMREKLNWDARYKIALGTADGLQYLHDNCQRRIIHRDIKADNILLTENFEPQICDFGLAKWLPRQWTHHNVSKFEGTFGYFAPEYFMHGIVDEKTDVYAFGVLLLELITGRQALDELKQSVVIWAKPLLDDNNLKELVDSFLGDAYNPQEMTWMVLTASLCIEQSPILRPRMGQVVVLLRGFDYSSADKKDRQRPSLRRTYSEEIMDAEEYNSTKYLFDLNRHKQLALGSS